MRNYSVRPIVSALELVFEQKVMYMSYPEYEVVSFASLLVCGDSFLAWPRSSDDSLRVLGQI